MAVIRLASRTNGASGVGKLSLALIAIVALVASASVQAPHPGIRYGVAVFVGPSGAYTGYVDFDPCRSGYAQVWIRELMQEPDSFPVEVAVSPLPCYPWLPLERTVAHARVFVAENDGRGFFVVGGGARAGTFPDTPVFLFALAGDLVFAGTYMGMYFVGTMVDGATPP